MAGDILVIDDEADIRDVIAGILEDEGYEVRGAGDADAALALVHERCPSLIVLDVWLEGSRLDGLELLAELKENYGDTPVIVISGHGNVETAVAAIRQGAYDFLEKPFKSDKLVLTTKLALENAKLKRENSALKAHLPIADALIGESAAIQQLRAAIAKVAPTNSRVMIAGPSGSGKELVARMLHKSSPRAEGEFVAINAAAIEPDRMESELFGEEAGAGRRAKVGVFERAHRGTLYLDEVGDMPLQTQSKILRLLVDQRFFRVGGDAPVQVDVRVISSTSRDLGRAIANGDFREDLFHRLAVMPMRVPCLEERREDIPALIDYFIARLAETAGLPRRRLSEDAVAALQACDWPGNVRQLRNNVERLLIMADGDPGQAITASDLPSEVMFQPGGGAPAAGAERLVALPLRDAREHFERQYLAAQINRFGGNVSKTASFIGMERSALHRKLKALGVDTGREGGLEPE